MNQISRAPEQPLPDIPYLLFSEPVTLTNCDREPIHVPGHAQAHGAVVVFDPSDPRLAVIQASSNVDRFFGLSAEALLGRGADEMFGPDEMAELAAALAEGRLEANPLYLFTGSVCGQGAFYATAHTLSGVLTLEFERADDVNLPIESASFRSDSHVALRQSLARLRSATSLSEYCNAVCEAVHEISGFDRAMLYRFHEDGHGEVIAEVIGKADTREPYLGLHYPESDIPKQARALYLLNSIRLMPDALYEAAPIVPALSPLSGQPLDMTYCVLRGYSRMYTEYLTNMGARASITLGIVRNGALWGLIACHHQSFRWVPWDVRAACGFLADVVSLQIADKEIQAGAEQWERSLELHRRLVESMARQGNVLGGLTADVGADRAATLLSLVYAGGCAVLSESECRLVGNTPSESEVRALAAWLLETRPVDEEVWATDALAALHPASESYKQIAAGLLTLRVTTTPETDWVLWFRPEVAQTVNWGGDPNKPYETDGVSDRLAPRKSFALWRETVSGRSLAWKTVEREAARRLRTAMTDVIVRRAEELTRLNAELERSNIELDAFAHVISHDLKEPLRGINNYVRFLREDHGGAFDVDAEAKLDTVVRLTRRMDKLLDSLLHYSRFGRQELVLEETDLNELVKETLHALGPRLKLLGVTVRVVGQLPTAVRCNAVQVDRLLTNLIVNATKYTDRSAGAKWVEIGCFDRPQLQAGNCATPGSGADDEPPIFSVRDNGIGISEKHFEIIFRIFKRLHGRGAYEGGTGAGLTIARKIVERHGGQLWLESVVGEGTTFYFTLAPGAAQS